MDRRDSSALISSSASSVRIGITPDSRGMPMSCMGTAARSEIRIAATSSVGSSSPTCRLPISRIVTTIMTYRINVRTKETNMFHHHVYYS